MKRGFEEYESFAITFNEDPDEEEVEDEDDDFDSDEADDY